MASLGLVLNKLLLFMEFRKVLDDDGSLIIKLSNKENQAVIIFIYYLIQPFLKLKNQPTSFLKKLLTVELALSSSRMIYHDKSLFFNHNFQIMKSLKILALDLTLSEKDYLNYWNSQIQDLFKKSWFQAKTDYADLDLNLSNGFLHKTIQNSWFSNKLIKAQNKNSRKIFLVFYKYLLVDGTVKEDTLLRMKKIKIKINSIQKKTFNIWNNHSRLSYNKAINLINESNNNNISEFNLNYFKIKYPNSKVEKVSSNNKYSKLDLRDLITPELVNSKIPWILQTPKAVREGAVFQAYSNYESALTNYKNGNINNFRLKFQSKKKKKWSLTIPDASIKIRDSKNIGIYEERTTNFRIKLTEKVEKINNECKIHYNGKDYFFCVPYKPERKILNQSKDWFCALDPGIRKFQVLYNADKDNYIKIGDNASKRMYDLLKYLDFLLKKPKQNKIKIIKLRIKIENYQTEMHCKISKYLCENFNNILIPKLTKNNDIVKLKKRKLTKSVVRKMNVLGHCKFIERLKTKAKEYEDVNVKIIGEMYTSQTCLNCKNLTKTSKEIFKCKNCNLKIDRDILGSTNILLFNW